MLAIIAKLARDRESRLSVSVKERAEGDIVVMAVVRTTIVVDVRIGVGDLGNFDVLGSWRGDEAEDATVAVRTEINLALVAPRVLVCSHMSSLPIFCGDSLDF